MRTNLKLCVPSGLIFLLGLMVSVVPFSAQAGRGTAPRGGTTPPQNSGDTGNRGNRGNNNAAAQARQQIQANRKAAVEQANAMYRLAMTTAQHDAHPEMRGPGLRHDRKCSWLSPIGRRQSSEPTPPQRLQPQL